MFGEQCLEAALIRIAVARRFGPLPVTTPDKNLFAQLIPLNVCVSATLGGKVGFVVFHGGLKCPPAHGCR